MQALAFMLVCLAGAGHGQRAEVKLHRNAQAQDVSYSREALARFLLAVNPPAGWQFFPAVVDQRSCRRNFLQQWAAAGLLLPGTARAFENSLPYPDSQGTRLPPKPGPPPKDIGIQKVTGKLKPCMDTKPHCFSTSGIKEFDEEAYDEGVGDPGLMKPWTFTKSRAEAMTDVLTVIKAYPPGQSGIDGGGWKIMKEMPDYVYVQYESLLKGFLDDMEFSILRDGELSLRTSSRVGRQDKLVNSKRVNYYAEALGGIPGWTTKPVTKETNPTYFYENTVSQSRNDDMKRLRGDVYSSADGMKGF